VTDGFKKKNGKNDLLFQFRENSRDTPRKGSGKKRSGKRGVPTPEGRGTTNRPSLNSPTSNDRDEGRKGENHKTLSVGRNGE